MKTNLIKAQPMAVEYFPTSKAELKESSGPKQIDITNEFTVL